MGIFRHHIILVLWITWALAGAVHGEPQYSDTPAVAATAVPLGGTVVNEEAQHKPSPS